MSLHWLQNRETRKQIKVVWEKGSDNKANYVTKHHSIIHHRQQRPRYVRDYINFLCNNLQHIYNCTNVGLQGCVDQSYVSQV